MKRLHLAAVAVPALGGAVGATATLVAWSHLPATMAVHWNAAGVPNGTMARPIAAWVFPAALAVLAGLLARPVRGDRGDGWAEVAISTLITFILGYVHLAVLVANSGAGRAEGARLPGGWVAGLAAGTAALLAVVTIGDRFVSERPGAADRPPARELAQSERLVWYGRARQPLWIVVAFGALGLAALGGSIFTVLLGCATAILALGFEQIAVTASRAGVRVAYGPWHWPRQTVALTDIDGASTTWVRPIRYGGWGYRGSLKLLRSAAVVIRAGPALRLALHHGRTFVVTVDDADTAAAVLNGLTDQPNIAGAVDDVDHRGDAREPDLDPEPRPGLPS